MDFKFSLRRRFGLPKYNFLAQRDLQNFKKEILVNKIFEFSLVFETKKVVSRQGIGFHISCKISTEHFCEKRLTRLGVKLPLTSLKDNILVDRAS